VYPAVAVNTFVSNQWASLEGIFIHTPARALRKVHPAAAFDHLNTLSFVWCQKVGYYRHNQLHFEWKGLVSLEVVLLEFVLILSWSAGILDPRLISTVLVPVFIANTSSAYTGVWTMTGWKKAGYCWSSPLKHSTQHMSWEKKKLYLHTISFEEWNEDPQQHWPVPRKGMCRWGNPKNVQRGRKLDH
jgi:hypothetical protein